jgi:hypothetical protein
MSYNDCRDKFLEDIMKEFKEGKLKLRNGKKVVDRRQAIAIALSMAQSNCKYTKKDLEQVEKKVMMFLKEDTRKISENRVPLTNVIETKVLMKNLIKMGQKLKAHKLYMLLIKRIVKAGTDGIKIDQNIFEEMNEMSKLI